MEMEAADISHPSIDLPGEEGPRGVDWGAARYIEEEFG